MFLEKKSTWYSIDLAVKSPCALVICLPLITTKKIKIVMTLLIIDSRSAEETQAHAQNPNDFYFKVVDLCCRAQSSFHG